MPLKPLVDIAVNTEAFDRFMETFKSYEDKLQDMPAEWTRVNTAVNDFAKLQIASGVGSAEAFKNAAKLTTEMAKATKAQAAFEKATGGSVAKLSAAQKMVKGISHELFGMGKHLLRLGEIGGITGLIGFAAGGFGLDALAGGARQSQFTAQGMGISTGALKAFKTDLSEYVGSNVLQGAANSQHDLAKGGAFAAAGINSLWAANAPATQVAVREMEAAARAYKLDPSAQNPVFAQGLGRLGWSYEDFQRNGLSNAAWRRASERQMLKDSTALNNTPQENHAFAQFKNALERAGALIDRSLIQSLESLASPLSKLTTVVSQDISALLTSPATRKAIREFADYLGSPKLVKDIRAFGTDVELLGKEMVNALKWLGLIPASTPAAPAGSTPSTAKPQGFFNAPRNAGNWSGAHPLTIPSIPGSGIPAIPLGEWYGGKYADHHNPLNLRSAPGYPTVNGFAAFPDANVGLAEAARQLGLYKTKYHIDTLAAVIKRWAPPSDHNNDAAYVAAVSKWTGLKPAQKIDLTNAKIRDEMVSAMARYESGARVTPRQVDFDIAHAGQIDHEKVGKAMAKGVLKAVGAAQKVATKPIPVQVTAPPGSNYNMQIWAAGGS